MKDYLKQTMATSPTITLIGFSSFVMCLTCI